MNSKVTGLIAEGLEWAIVAQAAAEGIMAVVEALKKEAATEEDVEKAMAGDSEARKRLVESIMARKQKEMEAVENKE